MDDDKDKEKDTADATLPGYDVEFIPVERRLNDRRADPNAPVPMDRRNYGRRKTDRPLPPADATPPEAGKG